MSMMDYTKFTKTKKPEVVKTEVPEVVKTEEIQNGVDEIVKPAVIGVVVDCEKLNIRSKPHGEVIGTIDVDSEVTIEDTFIDFYKVCTAAGAEGFCMKKFIRIKQ